MRRAVTALLVATALAAAAGPAAAQRRAVPERPAEPSAEATEAGQIQLDFNDVELAVVIDTIAKITGKNFIYDDRVRGRVTIVSPSTVSVDQAYAVFESVLQVKGFTTVEGPGGVIKIIPIRDAKESSIETVRGRAPSPNRDTFVTRLIPLQYIDAEAITNTVKPLVSKDAAMVAYAPTNTIILTDTAANIRRLLSILEAIDVESYKQELAVIKVVHADAATLGQQISDIYGAEVTGAASPRRTTRSSRSRAQAARTTTDVSAEAMRRGKVRIITDDRTNSLIVLASRGQLEDVRDLIRKLDVPVTGGGAIRVYYLKHADAEELAQTLTGLVSSGGGPAPSTGRAGPGAASAQSLRSAVTELQGGVNLTADPATNSLIIQASKEAYETLAEVIALLDIERPQVLVEGLIMEVDVTDGRSIGINTLLELTNGLDLVLGAVNEPNFADALATDPTLISGGRAFFANLKKTSNGNTIRALIVASADDDRTNIISAPHILTSDNEEAEIRIGDNIPIVTSRVDAARGATVEGQDALSSSVNIERQDIGVTLRVTPQISEGDSLRMKVFQEITELNTTLSVGEQGFDVNETGPALTNRRIENTVVVDDGETIVIGGLLSDNYQLEESKTPFLGDIPILGWLFKRRDRALRKVNLLVFLTPNIVRTAEELESETIRKREEFKFQAGAGFELSREDMKKARELGIAPAEYRGRNPARRVLLDHEKRYPLQRMAEIEETLREQADAEFDSSQLRSAGPFYLVRADVYQDADAASEALGEVLDAGYDGALVSQEQAGVVMFEIQVGPYERLEDAVATSSVFRESYGMSAAVMVVESEDAAP